MDTTPHLAHHIDHASQPATINYTPINSLDTIPLASACLEKLCIQLDVSISKLAEEIFSHTLPERVFRMASPQVCNRLDAWRISDHVSQHDHVLYHGHGSQHALARLQYVNRTEFPVNSGTLQDACAPCTPGRAACADTGLSCILSQSLQHQEIRQGRRQGWQGRQASTCPRMQLEVGEVMPFSMLC
jgi:hypothetical protein